MPTARTRGRATAILLLVVAVLVVAYAVHHPHRPARPRPVPSPPVTSPDSCARAYGPFRDRGTEVLQRTGTPYIPYGITVSGLAHPGYQAHTTADAAQIQAAARQWCANTVRLQVSQDNLVGRTGESFSASFLRAIRAEVALAENYGLVTVITAQTEDVGHEPGPTAATGAFWQRLAAVYGHDPQVVFDLFNEPSLGAGQHGQTWQLWQHGGPYRGVFHLGMQNLLDEIRLSGARNLVWVEGPGRASTLSGVPSHTITGGPLMYSIHHPAGAHNAASWWHDFGFLVTRGIAPVVVGEWSNYAAAKTECWADAPAAVPAFLAYLQRHGIGMTVWALKPGVMIQSGNLADPTRIRSNWTCRNGLNEGAGQQVMNWYERQNARPHHAAGTPPSATEARRAADPAGTALTRREEPS